MTKETKTTALLVLRAAEFRLTYLPTPELAIDDAEMLVRVRAAIAEIEGKVTL